ncbi:MAG TPA: type 1 glutamine amidotransferase domain-containing protein [Polyangiaceae bacterium]|nr:type 1 glutamine amidotransferase domain-containing protein [Polyangiaceae bacterium]
MLKQNDRRLNQKRIAILVADGFEYVELVTPRKALLAAGAQVDVVSLHRGKVRGMNLTVPTKTIAVDRTVDEADPADYDGLFIPGGFVNPDFLRQSRAAREFARAFDEAKRPVATLCHGPWLLASAELVQGRRLTSWPGIRDDMVHAGAIWRDEEVVRDGNWVSSRSPADLPAFVPAMLDLFASGIAINGWVAPAGDVASSPKLDRPLDLAVKAARLLPGPTIPALAGAAFGFAVGALAARRA